MMIAYFDTFCGASGDMILGSLLDAGLSIDELRAELAKLPLKGYGIACEKATRCGLAGVKFYSLNECITAGAEWHFRPWTLPQEGGRVVGKDLPAWYSTRFKHTPDGKALYLRILAAKKGQMYLNGRNIGRFWTTGPQECYCLPECWLAEQNQLLLFTEGGENPGTSRLERRPRGPFND